VDASEFIPMVVEAGAALYPQARLSIHILILASEFESKRMPRNLFRGEYLN